MTLKLFDPRYTAAHRCGLGGLACAIRWLRLSAPKLVEGVELDEDEIRLRFDDPLEFFRQLYDATFQIKDGFILLSCALSDRDATLSDSRKLFQNALFGTVLQSDKAKTFHEKTVIQSNGKPKVVKDGVSWYIHQDGYLNFFSSLKRTWMKFQPETLVPIKNYYVPSYVERHPGGSGGGLGSFIAQPMELALPLHFFIVGSPSFLIYRNTSLIDSDIKSSPTNPRYGAAFAIPNVCDLRQFAALRPTIHTSNPLAYTAIGMGDVAIRCCGLGNSCQGINIYFMDKSAWNPNQSCRLRSLDVDYLDLSGRIEKIKNFAAAAESKHKDYVERYARQKAALNGDPAPSGKLGDSFYNYAIALLYSNLVADRPWWQDFRRLVSDSTDFSRIASAEPLKEIIMTLIAAGNKLDPETLLIQSIHDTLDLRYAAIKAERLSSKQTRSKYSKSVKNMYIDIRNAGDPHLLRYVINCILGRSAADAIDASTSKWRHSNSITLQRYHEPILRQFIGDKERWQDVQSLALVALATYRIPSPPLRLIKDDVAIPAFGRTQTIIGNIDGVLQFRIFDDEGKVVVDANANQFPAKQQEIQELTTALANGLIKTAGGSKSIISLVANIVGN